MALSQISRRRCPACQSDRVLTTRSRGMLQEFYEVLGAELRRCHDCATRHAFLGPFTLKLGQPQVGRRETNYWLVTLAILCGAAFCLLVAFLVLRHFHRLPW